MNNRKLENYTRVCIRCEKIFNTIYRTAKICEDCRRTNAWRENK